MCHPDAQANAVFADQQERPTRPHSGRTPSRSRRHLHCVLAQMSGTLRSRGCPQGTVQTPPIGRLHIIKNAIKRMEVLL
jgi:hypothetical protein